MTPELRAHRLRIIHISTGVTLMVVAAVLAVFAIRMMTATLDEQAHASIQLQMAESARRSCLDTLRSYEFDATPSGMRIEARQPDLSDPQLRLGQASAAMHACLGFDLAEFCMGPGCDQGGIYMVLREPRRPK